MKYKIIIIDDHLLVNDGLALILQESGFFDVKDKVYDSRLALDRCAILRPDLVLLDYNMPYLNGLEVVRQFRNYKLDSKIVIVSMDLNMEELASLKHLDVDAVILKTTPSKDLIQTLLGVINGDKFFLDVKMMQESNYLKSKTILTKRELEVMKLVKKGYSTEEIARSLELSYYTVETHRKNVNFKMKFNNKIEFYEFLKNLT